MPETAPIDRYLDVKECAKILRMSVQFIYQHLWNGTGPRFKKFGNRYRIRHSDLMKWQPPQKDK